MTLLQTLFGTSVLDLVIRLLLVALGTCLGVVLSSILTPPTQVLRISEKDGRGWELNVKRELTKFLETKSKPSFRILKWGRSYEFVFGWLKKKVTRFIAKEGSAYSWKIFGFDRIQIECSEEEAEEIIEKEIPIMNPDTGNTVLFDGEPAFELQRVPVRYEDAKIDLEFETLAEVLEWKWGPQFYKTIPQKKREELLDNQVLVTVELESGLTPEGYTPITEQDIDDEGDRNLMKLYAEGAKNVMQIPYIQYMFVMGFGGLLVLGACLLLGYIPVGGS